MIRMVITVCLFVSSRTPRPTLCKFLLFFFSSILWSNIFSPSWSGWHDCEQTFLQTTLLRRNEMTDTTCLSPGRRRKTTLEGTQTCGCCAEDSRGTEGNNPGASKLGERSRWQQQNYWRFSGRGTNYVRKLLTKIITIFSTRLEETVMLVETTQLSIQKKRSEEEQQNSQRLRAHWMMSPP